MKEEEVTDISGKGTTRPSPSLIKRAANYNSLNSLKGGRITGPPATLRGT